MFSRSLIHNTCKITKILKATKIILCSFLEQKTAKGGRAWRNFKVLEEENETTIFHLYSSTR